jgi:two-component system, OmpR family, sensor kinase
MSLRKRLVLTVVGLLVVGLAVALGATFGALQDWQGDENDDVLTAAARQLGADPELSAGAGSVTDVWRRLAATGDLPSYFDVRDADGRLLEHVGTGPALPDPLPADHLPAEVSPENPDGGRFVDTDDGWLVRTSRTDDGVLVVAMRTTRTDELVTRTRNVALGSGALALLAVALLSWHAVRRGMRPLDRITATAREIGSGDLDRRVPDGPPDTEVGQLSTALNGMLAQLETAFAERAASQERLRRFVADASHELRTPIATIRGHAELFRRGAASRPADLAKVLHRVEVEAERMGALVDELLLLARLDAGRPLDREPVDLVALAEAAVGAALVAEPDRAITLTAPAPVTVPGDATRLRQVLDNLLSNVLRHTPPTATATVRVTATPDTARIEVADTGPGLSEEDQSRVFERFYRADPSRSRDSGGSGLGLSIVAAVVEAHGGSAGVRSTPDTGTTVHLTLPTR